MERSLVALGNRAGAGGHACQGIWYAPDGAPPRVGVIATHYEVDFSEHYLADLLAVRGFGFLGWNTRFRGNGSYFLLEPAIADIGAGVAWMRETAGVEKVVLLGNSGGASLMAAYQSLGPSRGDLFVSLNAHPGRPEVLTAWMDPSVTDEDDPLSADPALDMFEQSLPFAAGFVGRYREAQRARNDKITAWARTELERVPTDRVFCVHRTWADLRFRDMTIDPSDREPGCYLGDPARANYGAFGIGRTCTLRSWLSMWSLEESRCSAEPHLAKITEPSLVIQSTADQGCFPSDALAIHDGLASPDKSLEMIPGDHYFLAPDGAREAVADRIAGWIEDHGG